MNAWLYFLVWYAIGLSTTIYWVTEDDPIRLLDVPILLFVSILGPIVTLVAGIDIVKKKQWFLNNCVIFKKRIKKQNNN